MPREKILIVEDEQPVAAIIQSSLVRFGYKVAGWAQTGSQAVDLNRAIEITIAVCRNEWKYVAEMVTDFAPELPPVPCLPSEFNQVVLNLITNATHAIADVVGSGENGKGTIRISTRRDEGWAEVRVSDTGTGIPPEAKARIFTPFFTTKKVGKGTGQGLARSRAVIVGKHGGTIGFETEEGKGTTFTIRLPLEAAAAQAHCHEKANPFCR